MKLEPRCPICEARGCFGHGSNEKEVKAYSLDISLDSFERVKQPRLKKHFVFRTVEEYGIATVDQVGVLNAR